MYIKWLTKVKHITKHLEIIASSRLFVLFQYDFVVDVDNRVLLRILIFREKICLCKKPFGNHILIIFKLKKDFFTFNKVFKKARNLFASLLSKVVSAHVSVAVCHEQKSLSKANLQKELPNGFLHRHTNLEGYTIPQLSNG